MSLTYFFRQDAQIKADWWVKAVPSAYNDNPVAVFDTPTSVTDHEDCDDTVYILSFSESVTEEEKEQVRHIIDNTFGWVGHLFASREEALATIHKWAPEATLV